MLFNSFEFLVFFPLVVLVYFLLGHRFRWIFLLAASYYFYMNWQPIYAVLIFFSTLITWGCGVLLENAKSLNQKRIFLTVSLIINFGILFLYKYFDFINSSIFGLLENFGIRWSVPNLDLLLPVGISFYTFQAVGYTIDVYRGDLKAERHLGIYALFVSFFPQLVAGPIERAKNLLSQFYVVHKPNADRFASGIRQMIWGYFMKVVIADRLALFVNATYNNIDSHNGTSLLIATIFFAFQIYCDFAGYTNIAIGAARMMGFDLMTNFRRPYFSTSIGEFWHRWHISLSTWFRDYLYIPLGGNRVSVKRNYFNVLTTFIVSGIWHGANWTFVVWGSLHGIYNALQRALSIGSPKNNRGKFTTFFLIISNFFLVLLAWIFFRANNVGDAVNVIVKIFTEPGMPFKESITTYLYGVFGLVILIVKEIREEYYADRIKLFESERPVLSAFFSAVLVVIILSFGVFDGSQFIYFQF
ncbi:MAG: MBOAT family protein [Ignavibacteriales bacterium]|nr:MAG: MBOAT family protein [Ignavibacteriales bacterium]